ncbi:MAG TPA: hypothetical protein DIV79_08200 [Opitutae bacterium]|nr:hypothetical protein [Opitutaceae bacterium]HCR29981.1 hypothetical protein [Opitutae bacterium]
MADRIVLNGELVEQGEISLPVNSEGLSYGYGLFETIKIRDGRLCFFNEHCERHKASVFAAGMSLGFSNKDLFWQARSLIEASSVVDGALKIVTAKSGSKNLTYLHFKRTSKIDNQRPTRIRLSSLVKGSSAFTVKHKTLNYMDNISELSLAEEHGFDECLFTNERGELTECSMANIFFERSGAIQTPSLDCGLLDGIVRAKVIKIAKESGLSVLESKFYPEDLEDSERVFITSSGKGIAPVEEVDFGRILRFDDEVSGVVKVLSSRFDELERESLGQYAE